MTNEEKEMIKVFRDAGIGYSAIAKRMDISVNTIKTFCKRNDLGGDRSKLRSLDLKIERCDNCGKPVLQNKHRKRKRFCSDLCRNNWWNAHQYQIDRKANYKFICKCCGHVFISYGNANRKYCSSKCYLKDRFKGVDHASI